MSTTPRTEPTTDSPMTPALRYSRNYATYLLSGLESDQPMPCPTADGLDRSEATRIHRALVSLPIDTLRHTASTDEWNCTTCGFIHEPCNLCGKPTECPAEEIGQQYTVCHLCDLGLQNKDGA